MRNVISVIDGEAGSCGKAKDISWKSKVIFLTKV